MSPPADEDPAKPRGKPLLLDKNAASGEVGRPAFLARPPGAPVYHGFPLVEETRTEGWCYGAISDFLHADTSEGCTYGDGYVQAPDGSRAGLVWEVGDYEPGQIRHADDQRWGVYQIYFPRPIRTIEDLVYNFRSVLPYLRRAYDRAHRRT